MNLMCLIGKDAETQKTRVEQITKALETENIKLIPYDQPNKTSKDCRYYHNGVPNIPMGIDVMSRWDDCIEMRVNWDSADVRELPVGYGFAVTVSPLITDELREEFLDWAKDRDMRQSTLPYSIAAKLPKKTHCIVVFDDQYECLKHLKWFKKCFSITKEQDGSKREAKLYNYGGNNG